jgi:hypothetical protein
MGWGKNIWGVPAQKYTPKGRFLGFTRRNGWLSCFYNNTPIERKRSIEALGIQLSAISLRPFN